jgi:hypothetical protein
MGEKSSKIGKAFPEIIPISYFGFQNNNNFHPLKISDD